MSEASLLDSTGLAVERTVLALERTLMAWVRTATSLISFGFTIYKFFQYLAETKGFRPRQSLLGPREFGMLMISIAAVMLVLAVVRHRRSLRALRKAGAEVPRSEALLLAALIAGLAILALLAMIFRE
jgi:putative membrane protein